MAMRLADTFLVHPRSCFDILFSGQTPHWSLPRLFWDNAAGALLLAGLGVWLANKCLSKSRLPGVVRATAVKYPCDASRARAADDSIGGPQMLKFLNALAALAAVGSFVIAFLDSYEVRFKVRRRTRGADGRRHLRRNKRK